MRGSWKRGGDLSVGNASIDQLFGELTILPTHMNFYCKKAVHVPSPAPLAPLWVKSHKSHMESHMSQQSRVLDSQIPVAVTLCRLGV